MGSVEKRKFGDLTSRLHRYISFCILSFNKYGCLPIDIILLEFTNVFATAPISAMGMGGLESNSEPAVPIVS